MSSIEEDRLGEVVFKDDDWLLTRDYYPGSGKACITIAHQCTSTKRHMVWQNTDLDTTDCFQCKAKIPEEINGFWKLANWER